MGEDPGEEVLAKTIPSMGADLVRISDGEIEVEFFPNRPDLYSVEGVARALRNYLGLGGIREYDVSPSGYTLTIEDSVKGIRPHMVSGVARNVVFDDGFIKSIMQVQEKLHATLGRGRKKVAIGIHDLDKVQPPFFYRGVKPRSVSFVPLGWGRELNLQEILEQHEKGKDYAHVVEGKPLYPLFADSDDNVLSFPPIINGVLTEVHDGTENVLLDVTGTDERAVNTALNILMTLFAERGSTLQHVEIIDGEKKEPRPDLSPSPTELELDYANRLLGLDLSPKDAVGLLNKMGYGAKVEKGKITAMVPCYRADILHPVDIVEDMAIAYGYDNFEPKLPQRFTPGKEREATSLERNIRQFMVGLGFLEVLTFTLIGKKDQYARMRLEEEEGHILNPLTQETNSLRTWLIPSLFQTLEANRHRDLPQKLFEVDDVIVDGENRTHLAGVMIASKTGFTEMKSTVQAVVDALKLEMEVTPKDHASFLPGRCAAMKIGGNEIGFFGEIHPEVITNYELGYPVTAFELSLDEISSR